MREQEQSADTVRRDTVHTDQGVGEHESEQQAAAREEVGVREQEQSANTVRRAIVLQTTGCENTSLNNGQQQERSRECESTSQNNAQQQERSQGYENTSQNNAQQQESIIMEHNIIN